MLSSSCMHFSQPFHCRIITHMNTIISSRRLHALPVVDAKYGNLVGIVTAKDVMRDVMKTANKALPSEDSFSQSMADIPEDLAA